MSSFAFVQAAAAVATPSSPSLTFASPNTAGNLVVAYYGQGFCSPNLPPTSVTDNNGNVYHLASQSYVVNNTLSVLYIAIDIVVTPNNPLTVTFTGGSSPGFGPDLIIAEYAPPADYQIYAADCDQDGSSGAYGSAWFYAREIAGVLAGGTITFSTTDGRTSNAVSALVLINPGVDALIIACDYNGAGPPPPVYSCNGTIRAANYQPATSSINAHASVLGDLSVAMAGGCGTVVAANCNNPPAGAPGVPYTHTFTASGGTPPYTFAITAGSLPPGITLASGGVASGTPTTIYAFTLQATDANGLTATVNCTIKITCAGVVGTGNSFF